jgi:hypothetical protein
MRPGPGFKGSVPVLAVPGGPFSFRAHSGGRSPQGKPGYLFSVASRSSAFVLRARARARARPFGGGR